MMKINHSIADRDTAVKPTGEFTSAVEQKEIFFKLVEIGLFASKTRPQLDPRWANHARCCKPPNTVFVPAKLELQFLVTGIG